jgi:hypothetical protein
MSTISWARGNGSLENLSRKPVQQRRQPPAPGCDDEAWVGEDQRTGQVHGVGAARFALPVHRFEPKLRHIRQAHRGSSLVDQLATDLVTGSVLEPLGRHTSDRDSQ